MARLKIAQVATVDLSIRYLLLDQIQALMEMGHEVVAVCAPGSHVPAIRAQGVEVETVPMVRELSPWQDRRSRVALTRCFRERGFDVVHTHTPKAGLLGPFAARRAKVPIVVHTIHGLLFHDRMSVWRRLLYWMPEKITAGFSDYLLAQSREDVEVAVRTHLCPPGKISYLGNGIDVGRFSPEAAGAARAQVRSELGFRETDFVIGSVGRLVYEKGFRELFAAAQAIAQAHPDAKFLVIGPTEENARRDAVSPALLDELQKLGAVRFTGWRDDLPRYYAAMDAFAMPSHREGVPRGCLEAAAMQLPVVATDIRGCREVVRPGETGLLVPLRDQTALRQALVWLIENRAKAAAMGHSGRRHVVANFDARSVLERLRAFYLGLEARMRS
jgi:glycosyltransferase involved in cell wall biosynthesis